MSIFCHLLYLKGESFIYFYILPLKMSVSIATGNTFACLMSHILQTRISTVKYY